jgi:hypothetical protein
MLTAQSSFPLQREALNSKPRRIYDTMPAKEILPLFRRGQLHSGSSSGPIVSNPHQAKAIQMGYARKEGANIPPAPKKRGIGHKLAALK